MRRRRGSASGGRGDVGYARRFASWLAVAWTVALGPSCLALPGQVVPAPTAVRSAALSAVSSAAHSPPPARDDGRLPNLAIPAHYWLDLEVDPQSPRFSGRVTIRLNVQAPTYFLALHAGALVIPKSTIVRVGDRRWYGRQFRRTGPNAHEELLFEFADELPVGLADLTIWFDAPFARESHGVFRSEESGRWYAFTQFEACAARKAFPSFDEPGFKVPFDVAITVPPGMTAFGNMPVVERVTAARGSRFQFATTPPIPTYLVAFAVGDFDVDVGPISPVPIRLIRRKGIAGDARHAMEIAQQLTDRLAAYFGVAYPFAKLDLVAAPLDTFGAMENVGLITVREPLLLSENGKTPAEWAERHTYTLAHELAHQWVGNLVTPRWWDDAWLSEGLATFVSWRVLDRWRPSLIGGVPPAPWIDWAMEQDALATTAAVRHPVVTPSEAEEMLRGTHPAKAGGMLAMIERWIGEETMARGIRRYLGDHAWKNATTDDFVASLEATAEKPLSAVVRTFLDQKGLPQLTFTPHCEQNALVSLGVRQEPFRVAAATSGSTTDRWSIPFCLAFSPGGKPWCQVLSDETAELSIDGVQLPCPTFVDFNAGLAGYYRYVVSAHDLDAARSVVNDLGAEAKFGLLTNAWAAVVQHGLQPDALLRFLPALDATMNPEVTMKVAGILGPIGSTFIDPPDERAYADYVLARFARRKERLGLTRIHGSPPVLGRQSPEEDDHAVSTRADLLWLLAHNGDPDVLDAAAQLTRQWAAAPRADVDPDIGEKAIALGTRRADDQVLEKLEAEIAHPASAATKAIALHALGDLQDPAWIRRVLELTLGPPLSDAEVSSLLWRLAADQRARPIVYEWIDGRWSSIVGKWHGSQLRPFWQLVRFACDAAQRDALESTFKRGSASVADDFRTDFVWYRERRKVGETCEELKRYGAEGVARFLRSPLSTKAH